MIRWINTTEMGVLATLVGFSARLNERREMYGVSEAEAVLAAQLVAAAEEAMVAASDPATRTRLTTAAKNVALRAAKMHCVRLSKLIAFNANLSEADRVAISVGRPAPPRRIPAPTTRPVLQIIGIIPGGHEIHAFDPARPGRRGKPKDVDALELWVAYSANDGSNGAGMDEILAGAEFHSVLRRTRCQVLHPDERVGSVANYIGRWINGRFEPGPWSQPVSMVLALPGGGVNAQRDAA